MFKKPLRVLTTDGGGMRGLYSVALLRNLLTLFSKSETLQIEKVESE